jgi:hypothetical protein
MQLPFIPVNPGYPLTPLSPPIFKDKIQYNIRAENMYAYGRQVCLESQVNHFDRLGPIY